MTRREDLGAITGRLDRILLDANALIYHPRDPQAAAVLEDGDRPIAERRQVALGERAAALAFYRFWEEALERDNGALRVSDAVLDLELSGHRWAGRRLAQYRRRFKPLPRGDIAKAHDPASLRKAKNRLLAVLHRDRRLNSELKKKARGLRAALTEELFDRPIWSGAMAAAGLSEVDQDLARNLVAAGALGPAALVTRDRALLGFIRQLARNLARPGWERPEARALAERLTEARFEVLSWEPVEDGASGGLVFVSP